MNPNLMDTNDDQIDRILLREGEIIPSAGFTASVMEAVRQEASAPAPIPFPWKRAWPVLALAGAAIVLVPIAAVVAILRAGAVPIATAPLGETISWAHLPGWMSNPLTGWVTGSLLLAFLSVKFSMRLASR